MLFVKPENVDISALPLTNNADMKPQLLADELKKVVSSDSLYTLNAWISAHDINAKDADGWTALHWAAYSNAKLEIIKTLINAGADVNAKGKTGETPLFLADHHHKSSAVARALFEAGANPNAKVFETMARCFPKLRFGVATSFESKIVDVEREFPDNILDPLSGIDEDVPDIEDLVNVSFTRVEMKINSILSKSLKLNPLADFLREGFLSFCFYLYQFFCCFLFRLSL